MTGLPVLYDYYWTIMTGLPVLYDYLLDHYDRLACII